MIKEGEAVPDIYADPVYLRGSRWVLSTSQIFSSHFDVYGWGEVVPDGFGIPYMIFPGTRLPLYPLLYIIIRVINKSCPGIHVDIDSLVSFSDKLMFTVTSRKDMPNEKMSKELARAAEDLKELFQASSVPSAKL